MSSAWLLPEHVCDVLPAEARRIEELRRDLPNVENRHDPEVAGMQTPASPHAVLSALETHFAQLKPGPD